MKPFLTLLFYACIAAALSACLTSCQQADASPQTTKIQAEAPALMAAEIAPAVPQIDTSQPAPNTAAETVTIGGKTYNVLTGAKGGRYIMRERTRDTAAGAAGTTYKYYLPKG